jgi:hypothetical protein
MKKLTLFIILIVCTIVFTVPAWSKGGKDGDPPVIKTGETHKILVDIVKDGDPPAPPKDH